MAQAEVLRDDAEAAAPLVSCIMPTFDRRSFVPLALRYFLRQSYANKELIVCDDGTDPVADLVPDDPSIRYVRIDGRASVGAKRNHACELARGSIVAHWDDDDWQSPHRLETQVARLLSSGAGVCGLPNPLYLDARAPRAWRFAYDGGRAWLAGNSLCYRREVWERRRFADTYVGEDARFVWSLQPGDVAVCRDATIQVGLIHAANVSPKDTRNRYWEERPLEEVREILGGDWSWYVSDPASSLPPTGRSRRPARSRPEPARRSDAERSFDMLTVARRDDLELPEFAAYREGQTLPWMRRWELPFVLFRARLADTTSVLDCSVNPAGLGARLRGLYPHVNYRHHPPIQGATFAPPLGVPDEAFDRVICVNTLEHLLEPQREALVADMAKKLKPGGLLLLTSDYYFDSSWDDPAFLSHGVMRQDRSEVFNGYNRVGFAEWLRLCAPHGLRPSGPRKPADPDADDPTLYLNRPPHVHAVIGGAFSKPGGRVVTGGRKVVLALLSWNTRDVTLDSVRAYVREAELLKRLGHEPFVCVCDNGSTDGTPEALRELDPGLGVEHEFILNETNAGNATARNQIIDYMCRCDADYVLFMDGDIEIVPFSSVAMLRYMEANGSRLGCIGPHSWGQSPERSKTTRLLYAIDSRSVVRTDVVAWTQYGLFRREVFEDGIRFDEASPFRGPGWGFEDNDLMFQMATRGYAGQYFSGMTYLHRNVRSSVRIMRSTGVDVAGLYESRRRYLVEKWSSVPEIRSGPLTDVMKAVLP